MATAGAWDSLEPQLSAEMLDTLKNKLGFDAMTPVQRATIPQLLSHKDVVVEAVTGSGKTLAFLVPALELLKRRTARLRPHDVAVMIIAPTRELARQIHTVLMAGFAVEAATETEAPEGDASEKPGLPRVLLLTGGTQTTPVEDTDVYQRHGGNIIIGTPGRMHDVMQRLGSKMAVKGLDLLVLDEADRMLDQGFFVTMTAILERLPKQRRTAILSATQTQQVTELVRAGLRNPVKVSVKVETVDSTSMQRIPASLDNLHLICSPEDRLGHLLAFLRRHQFAKVVVYVLTGACVEYVSRVLALLLADTPLAVLSLHGKMVPKRRDATYASFVDATSAVLVATDVAARGLDVPNIDWIVQFDPPTDPNAFVHRIGRTARLGRMGSALVFLSPEEDAYIQFLAVRKVPIAPYCPAGKVASEQGASRQRQVLARVRRLILQDRDLLDLSTRAFVSWIRAYKEHACSFIFQFKRLDIGAVARGFALVTRPRMPELRGKAASFDLPGELTPEQLARVKYADKARQRAFELRSVRKQAAAAEARASGQRGKERPDAWSEKQRRRDRKRKRKDIKAAQRGGGGGGGGGGDDAMPQSTLQQVLAMEKQRLTSLGQTSDDEMMEDARLLKKLKKRKISEAEWAKRMGVGGGGDDAGDDDGDDDVRDGSSAGRRENPFAEMLAGGANK